MLRGGCSLQDLRCDGCAGLGKEEEGVEEKKERGEVNRQMSHDVSKSGGACVGGVTGWVRGLGEQRNAHYNGKETGCAPCKGVRVQKNSKTYLQYK